ncbi:MAG: hypothetical protein ACRDY2_11030 [Acidimicrobiales bacterium]
MVRLLLLMPVLTTFVALLLFAPAAMADSYGSQYHQHTSLYNYYSSAACVSIGEDTWSIPSYLIGAWQAAVGSSHDGGTLSWNASIEGWVGISYTPSGDCQDAYNVNSYDLVVHGDLYKWNGSAWGLCSTNQGSVYGPYWASTSAVTWGLRVYGSGVLCGAGWYYSDGTGRVLQNGHWQGYEPYLTNAGTWIYIQ